MKVKELIAELQGVDPEQEVLVETRFGYERPSGSYDLFIKYDKESDDYRHESSKTKKKGFKKCFVIDKT